MVGQPRLCRGCSRELPASKPYFRFALAVQGELDVLDTGEPGADDPRAVMESMGDVSAEDAEAEVHWETAGELCRACRQELIAWLGGADWRH
jgi:hypothetical protein